MDAAEEPSPLEALRGEWESMCVVLGEEHPETLEMTMDLARAYRQAGEPRQARTLLESVVASRQKALGVADLKTIQAETLLAFALADLGEPKRSRSMQKDVLERCEEIFVNWSSPCRTPLQIAIKNTDVLTARCSAGNGLSLSDGSGASLARVRNLLS